MTKRYRISNRFRFTVFVVLTIILLTTAINFALGLNTAASLTIQDYMDVEVKSGDTLWNIAQDYMPDDMDTRKAVFQLCSLNDISADQLYAGMTIQVPIYNYIDKRLSLKYQRFAAISQKTSRCQLSTVYKKIA